MFDANKTSLDTINLVDRADVAYSNVVANVAKRFKALAANNDSEYSIVHDLMFAKVRRSLANACNAGKPSKECRPVDSFDDAALDVIASHKTNPAYLAANKWVNRVRTSAGFPSANPKASGNTTRKKDRAVAPTVATIVAAPAATPADQAPIAYAVPKWEIPKPKAASDIGTIISALASMAHKVVSENAATIQGDARDALMAMVAAGRVYNEKVNPLVEKPSKRDAVIALAKKFNSVPVAELN